ncbi:hypothetical protein [Stappia sp.]|uniref:hypothetical protein n=1 Tax=Stappia sp. TaxID=1870903 RepID=UPI0032D91C2B
MSEDGVRMTDEQKKRQRARSIAIGLAVGGLVILFYVITLVKMGPDVLNRAM